MSTTSCEDVADPWFTCIHTNNACTMATLCYFNHKKSNTRNWPDVSCH